MTGEVCALQVREGNPVAAEIEALGVPVRTLDIRRLRQRDAYRQVLDAVAASDPDIVHTQLEFADILGTMAARRLSLPTIATLHTLDAPRPRSRDWARFRLTAWVLRRHGHRVVAVSESARRHHIDAARLDPGRVITLYNGIELDRFANPAEGSRAAVRAEMGIPGDVPVAVTVAVLREPKGLQHMIAALPAIAVAVPGVRYLIVGDGPHRAALHDAARAAGVDDLVVFAGARPDIPRMLAAADVFVLPSLIEALPTVLAEAGAAGLPVVATTVGGIPEMVARNQSALLVPPADPEALAEAVARLLANPRQARAMGRAARRITHERFDVRVRVAALVDEYRHLIATRSRR